MANKPKKIKPYQQPEDRSVVEEAAVHYASMRAILGDDKSMKLRIAGDQDLISLSRSGVRKVSLWSLSEYLGVSMEKMSILLHTSYRNIQRKDDNDLLDTYKSEQVLEIAQVISKALEIFGSKENMQQWLHSGIIALNGQKPIDLLDTSFGIRMLFRLLNRLEHGVYS